MRLFRRPDYSASRAIAVALGLLLAAGNTGAQQDKQLAPVPVSASRLEQQRFDAAASIDVIEIDPASAASPLVQLSTLLSGVPGVQVRERQNFAQDLQISVRGFGTRSTFGVRGVRLLVDGIPATMPDGQGQPAIAALHSARRIEVLRGPPAQLYGNAAGGVIRIFTEDPPLPSQDPQASLARASLGAGSSGQRQAAVTVAGGAQHLGALLDVSDYRTDGYRTHGAARRLQVSGKLKWQPAAETTLTLVMNLLDQPLAQDPLGLDRAQFERDPRGSVPAALAFNTRKSVDHRQAGLLATHRIDSRNVLHARVYAGTRKVFQTLSFSGSAPASSGGVVDLGNRFGGLGLRWTHGTRLNGLPFEWTLGVETDDLRQRRLGFVNEGGVPGALRRDEHDRAGNVDVFGQVDWTIAPRWMASIGARASRVRLSVDDRYVTAASPDDSGSVAYRNTSPVLGLAWFANEDMNVYANLGQGFETPTLTEAAYRPGGSGPNLALQSSRSVQAELGLKWKREQDAFRFAVFQARSRDEIVPQATEGGRSIYRNVDGVTRRGLEVGWATQRGAFGAQLAYTLLDARFREPFATAAGSVVAAGNRLPGTPRHSLFAQLEHRHASGLKGVVELQGTSRIVVDDLNSDAAPGHAIVNLSVQREFMAGGRWLLFARLDNVFDRHVAGSVIVNDGNRCFFEPAPGRSLFVGLRTAL